MEVASGADSQGPRTTGQVPFIFPDAYPTQGGADIPFVVRDPGLLMSGQAISTEPGIPTIFIGIVDDKAYTNKMWTSDVTRIGALVKVDRELIGEIKVHPRQEASNQVDADTLHVPLANALNRLNQWNKDTIRIVSLGKGSSDIMFDSFKGLVAGWNQNNKQIQFVTAGDTADRDFLEFCKWLCMKKMCHSILYYDTLDYDIMGMLDDKRRCMRSLRSMKNKQKSKRWTVPGILFLIALLVAVLSIIVGPSNLMSILTFVLTHCQALLSVIPWIGTYFA